MAWDSDVTSIHIDHFDIHYKLAAGSEEPASLQRRLDKVVSERLGGAWEAQLEHAGLDDEVYYFIERMAVDLSLDPARGDDQRLAIDWSRALQEGLYHTLTQRPEGVVIFRRRGELLASFVSDLLAGRAWERWYYAEFQALRGLPLGQAISAALTADGDAGLEALLELARRRELEAVLSALDDSQAERVASICLLPPGPRMRLAGSLPAWVDGLLDLLAVGRVILSTNRSRSLARLYLNLLCEKPELGPDVNLARFIDDLLDLASHLPLKGGLVGVERHGPTHLLRRLLEEAGLDRTSQLLAELSSATAVAPDAASGFQRRFDSDFAGLLLLAPAAADMGLYDFLAGCPLPEPNAPDPAPPGASRAGWLLFLVGLQCLGSANALRASRDPAVALFAGLDSPPARHELNAYAGPVDSKLAQIFSDRFQAFQAQARRNPRLLRPPPPLPAGWRDPSGWLTLASGEAPFLSPTLPSPGELEPAGPSNSLDAALAPLSASLLGWFAARLGAFAESSPAFLSRNFLESQAEIEVYAGRMRVRFTRCPLGLVLRMSGMNGPAGPVPWLGGRQLEFEIE
jgi:hypothetical protein